MASYVGTIAISGPQKIELIFRINQKMWEMTRSFFYEAAAVQVRRDDLLRSYALSFNVSEGVLHR
ncbi:hypothetical protein D3Y55_27220 [Mesorhizobium sp. DCY119]|nr:hypothetical protein D3Y55_27220 [Mesorhizobium sp. DCY119]